MSNENEMLKRSPDNERIFNLAYLTKIDNLKVLLIGTDKSDLSLYNNALDNKQGKLHSIDIELCGCSDAYFCDHYPESDCAAGGNCGIVQITICADPRDVAANEAFLYEIYVLEDLDGSR